MTDVGDTPVHCLGKYRGKVIDNADPLFQGRIIADVPSISGSALNWALPCTPYAGPGVGFYAIPPVGANVWIEFEGGDPAFPIWVGCFWGAEDILRVPEPPLPEVKIFRTEFVTMILNDVPDVGGFSLQCMSPAVDTPLTMTFDSTGITILCPESRIAMTPSSMTLSIADATLAMSAGSVAITMPRSTVELTDEAIELDAAKVGINGEIAIEGGGIINGAPIL